jgi:hypothetical protein
MSKSLNSDAFSQFSMPSNNLANGLKVNVPPHMQQSQSRLQNIDQYNMVNSMTSHEFSSVMKSQPTVNNMSVNLNRPPINPAVLHATQQMQPLQVCSTNYDGDIRSATSHYISEESSFVSAEYAAMNQEGIAKKRAEDKEMKL